MVRYAYNKCLYLDYFKLSGATTAADIYMNREVALDASRRMQFFLLTARASKLHSVPLNMRTDEFK